MFWFVLAIHRDLQLFPRGINAALVLVQGSATFMRLRVSGSLRYGERYCLGLSGEDLMIGVH
jgi:hypothetical protein